MPALANGHTVTLQITNRLGAQGARGIDSHAELIPRESTPVPQRVPGSPDEPVEPINLV